MRFRVNLDFDSALSFNDPKYINDKYVKELEYIFFLLNKSAKNTLVSKYDYSFDYLSHLENLGFNIPLISNKIVDYKNWWGDLSNFDLSKTLNSKCWLASRHAPLNDLVIDNKEQLSCDFPSYYRSDQGFSGINNRVLREESDFERLSFPGVQSKLVNVVQTFGITISLSTNRYFIIENLTDKNGKFKGGRLIDISELSLEINIESILIELRNILKDFNTIDIVQFDNMIYQEDGGDFKLCPIVEINYRKTMGSVIKHITDTLGHGTLYFGDRSDLSRDSIILSPDFVRNICYFNRA